MQYFSYYPRPVFSFHSPSSHQTERDLIAFFLSVYFRSPLWLRVSLRIWNFLLVSFGCDRLTCRRDINSKKAAVDYIEGDELGRFHMILSSTNEIVLEQDERHFCLRVSLTQKSEDVTISGSSGTLFLISGRSKTRLGRYYLALVQPFLMWFLRYSASSLSK